MLRVEQVRVLKMTFNVYKYIYDHRNNDRWEQLGAPQSFIMADDIEEAVNKFEPKELGRYMILGRSEFKPEVRMITATVQKVAG